MKAHLLAKQTLYAVMTSDDAHHYGAHGVLPVANLFDMLSVMLGNIGVSHPDVDDYRTCDIRFKVRYDGEPIEELKQPQRIKAAPIPDALSPRDVLLLNAVYFNVIAWSNEPYSDAVLDEYKELDREQGGRGKLRVVVIEWQLDAVEIDLSTSPLIGPW